MKHNLLTFLTALLLAPLTALHAAEKHGPNIIVILTDDQGWADLGAQGVDSRIRTPNVDQLARDGVRFQRGYVTAPQCTPSRAGLFSGRYQNKLGVEQNFDPMRSGVVTLPDPHEQRNLAADHDRAARLATRRAELDAWMKEQGDQQTVFGKPTLIGEPAPPLTAHGNKP